MEKIVTLLRKPLGAEPDNFRDSLLAVVPELKEEGPEHFRICVADSAVESADPFRIVTDEAYDAMISFWLDSARTADRYLGVLSPLAAGCSSYVVTESEPITHSFVKGERSPGMNQVVTLKQPERLSRKEWEDLWLRQHTQLAIDIQSTFGYRQNVVTRHLGERQPDFAAIVEENFPVAAMTSRLAFYNAEGNDELYQQREKQMMESTMRFIDFDQINCVPMSEYNF